MASLPSTKNTENTRLPLGTLKKYPDLQKEQDQKGDHGPSGVKSVVSKLPFLANLIPPRPRSGSAESRGASPQRGLIKQSYPLKRSKSSQPRRPPAMASDRTRVASVNGQSQGARGRCHSSNSVISSAYNNTTASREDSMEWLLSNLGMRRHKYGETHPRVGRAWNRIGNFFFRACEYSHALDAYKHAVMCYKSCEAELACTYLNMGTAYWASGRADKAGSFLKKALDLFELNLMKENKNPAESLVIASTLYQMGLCYSLQKQYGEAMACLQKCQKMQGSILGPMDVEVGRTLDAIGKIHYFKGEYSTALHCHEEARRIKSVSGENEASVVVSLQNIAAVHHATKNWTVAIAKYTQVMHLQKSELVRCRNQKGRPIARAAQQVGETLQLMGNMHLQMEQKEQARRYYTEASLVYKESGLANTDSRVEALARKKI